MTLAGSRDGALEDHRCRRWTLRGMPCPFVEDEDHEDQDEDEDRVPLPLAVPGRRMANPRVRQMVQEVMTMAEGGVQLPLFEEGREQGAQLPLPELVSMAMRIAMRFMQALGGAPGDAEEAVAGSAEERVFETPGVPPIIPIIPRPRSFGGFGGLIFNAWQRMGILNREGLPRMDQAFRAPASQSGGGPGGT